MTLSLFLLTLYFQGLYSIHRVETPPIFERCDDSNGEIGGVYGYEAANLFVDFANRCTDKQKVIDYVIKLNQQQFSL